jgi:hypothetical protein
MTNLSGKQTARSNSSNGYQTMSGAARAATGRIANVATLLVSIFCMAGLVGAQKTELARQSSIGQEMSTLAKLPAPQLEFAGKENYEVNGAQWTRYKLTVANRRHYPDFLWQPSPNLPPCGKNENAARTWVEVFGSPGGNRLGGFCGLRGSADLDRLWFREPSGESAPACVYIVMTDRQTGKKYNSNRVCSRSFAVATNPKNAGAPKKASKEKGIEIQGWDWEVEAETSWARTGRITGVAADPGDPSQSVNRKANVAQPDLTIKQFLFPPTNDKALRVLVVNQGNAASGACRLVLTVRKINGTAVGRQTHVNVPALAPGKNVWLVIDAKSILPNNVSLQSTTFKLNVDATGIVAESDETNNEVWHNL